LNNDPIPIDPVRGEVQVAGVAYCIRPSGTNEREVVRCSDGRRIGRLRGSPSSMWLLEADRVDEELLRIIVRTAIEEGMLVDLPSD
jgi:hypothetical protein